MRAGKLKVIARPVAIIGSGVDSQRGRLGMIAASKQNRAFNFAQLLYFNQGPEDGGWLDDTMVASAAKSIPGVNVAGLQAAAKALPRPTRRRRTTPRPRRRALGHADGARRPERRQADGGRAGARAFVEQMKAAIDAALAQ